MDMFRCGLIFSDIHSFKGKHLFLVIQRLNLPESMVAIVTYYLNNSKYTHILISFNVKMTHNINLISKMQMHRNIQTYSVKILHANTDRLRLGMPKQRIVGYSVKCPITWEVTVMAYLARSGLSPHFCGRLSRSGYHLAGGRITSKLPTAISSAKLEYREEYFILPVCLTSSYSRHNTNMYYTTGK